MWQRQGHARGEQRQGPQSVAGQSGAHQQGHWGIWSRCSCFGAAAMLATRRGGTGRALGGEKRTEMQVKAWGRQSDTFAFVATLTCGFELLATHAAGHNAPAGLTDGTSTKICNVGGTLREASGVAMWMAGALEEMAAGAEANDAAMVTATRVARAAVGGNESLVPEEAKRLERGARRAVETTRALRGQASRLAAVSIATESAAATIAEWALLLAYTLSGRNKNTCIDSTAITTVGQDAKSSAILTSKCAALYSDSAKKGFSPLTASLPKDEVTRIIAALGKEQLEGTVVSALTTDTGKHVGANVNTAATTASCPILAAYQDSTTNYGVNIDSSGGKEAAVTFGTFFTLTTKSSGSDGSIAFKKDAQMGPQRLNLNNVTEEMTAAAKLIGLDSSKPCTGIAPIACEDTEKTLRRIDAALNVAQLTYAAAHEE
ncbi:hypothetical protein, conserved in T. vivax [Trypanosoma vivax Y486]|uniref:Uncharacterized protein n=1 Tax=Trypanosoma vivax (strain Y486) TaxID=1055687 RepID=F9WTB6_TRYVY|nr:hypothetical protein, conserved in T. vivax [Trypanosoma vivax Y486]|eukprot:CCD20809.1 hypothetical protein, conserved in T. vivax [Trypanosoma vivax Y486]